MRLAVDGVIINKKGQVLVVKRNESSSAFPGCWALPGGGVEDTDPRIWIACKREMHEETGLVLSGGKYINYFDTMNRDPRNRVVSFAWLFTEIFPFPPVVAQDDVVDFKWVHWERLVYLEGRKPSMELAFDHNYIVTDAWYKHPESFMDPENNGYER